MNTNNNYLTEQAMNIASNLRCLRKGRKFSLQSLSEKSGVSYGSLRRFEETGEISLRSLLKVATVLDAAEPLNNLFKDVEPKSIEELIRRNNG